MNQIQLEPQHFKIVKQILDEFKTQVFVFGSRAKGGAKPLSDLDLCIKSNGNKRLLRELKDAFDESNLPFKVDIVDWSEISDSFRQHIEKDLIAME